MIIIYPMLTSESVSHNVLPGISKVLERFVIVYRLEKDMKRLGKVKDVNLKLIDIKLFRKQMKTMGESLGMDMDKMMEEADKYYNISEADPPGGKKDGLFPSTVNVGLPKQKSQGGPVKVEMPNTKDIMLEPTYITATTKSGPTLIGIKVIPYPLKTTKKGVKAAELLQSDKDLKLAYSLAVGMGRKLVRMLWSSWVNTVGKVFPLLSRTVSGDPKKDILFASTTFTDDTFVCMDTIDLQNSITQSASSVRKLHYMGWRSFILADNVNKRVNFCMKEFKGVCNLIPYSFLFSSLGTGQKQTFDDLEDIKKSSAAFFRKKVPKSKVFGEQFAQAQLSNMKVIDEGQIVQEGIIEFAKSMGNKIIGDSKKSVKSNDPEKLGKVLDKVPDVDVNKLKAFGKKQSPDFPKSYALAKRVIDNSLPKDVDDSVKDHYAVGIALRAVTQGGDAVVNTKAELKASMPAIMRAVGSGAGTAAWVLLWYYISQVLFTFSSPVTVTIAMIMVARGIYKHAKKEKKLDVKDADHKRKLQVLAKKVEKERAKAGRGPYIQTTNIQTSGE